MTPLISSLQQLSVSLCSVVTYINLYLSLFFKTKPSKTWYLYLFGLNYTGAVMMMCDCFTEQVQWWGFSFPQTWVCLFLNWIWPLGNETWVRSSLLRNLHWKPYFRYQSKSPCCEHLCLLWVLAIVRAVKMTSQRASTAMLHNILHVISHEYTHNVWYLFWIAIHVCLICVLSWAF